MNKNLRTTFNEQAKLYHLARPKYPEPLFDVLEDVAKLKKQARLLEIGPGTGQATESLANRGYEITAVELGGELVEVAQENLKPYKNVKIIGGDFEEIEFAPESFDLVYAATSFHWVSPEVRFSKPYKLLKSKGYLAIIGTHHVSDESGDEFFFATQPIYKKYKPGGKHEENLRMPHTADIKPDEVDEKLFGQIFFEVFPHTIPYSGTEYAQLLNTYSPTLSMTEKDRRCFLKEIEELINDKFGGSIMKHFAMSLMVARKKD